MKTQVVAFPVLNELDTYPECSVFGESTVRNFMFYIAVVVIKLYGFQRNVKTVFSYCR
jgi:hypothetical protein